MTPHSTKKRSILDQQAEAAIINAIVWLILDADGRSLSG